MFVGRMFGPSVGLQRFVSFELSMKLTLHVHIELALEKPGLMHVRKVSSQIACAVSTG